VQFAAWLAIAMASANANLNTQANTFHSHQEGHEKIQVKEAHRYQTQSLW